MRKRLYYAKNPEELFLVDKNEYGDTREEFMENMRNKNIAKNRVKSTWSGPMLEIEVYPLWNTPQGKRKKSSNKSTPAQRRLNDRNTAKKVARIVHVNFKMYKDLMAAFTYDNENLPETQEEAHRNMVNLIRRKRHWLKKQERYKGFKLKYILVTEYDDRPGKKVRIHHHMITNFPDRDVLEELWHRRGRVETKRLQPDEHGVEGLIWYILKDKVDRKTKRYTISRNMDKPKVTVADSKITRKRAERIATGEVDAQELFEKMYKGYHFTDIEMKFSEFTSGAYIYVRMKRIEDIQNIRKRE